MKLFTMKSSPAWPPQHPDLQQYQTMFVSSHEIPSFAPIYIIVLYILNFIFLDTKREDKTRAVRIIQGVSQMFLQEQRPDGQFPAQYVRITAAFIATKVSPPLEHSLNLKPRNDW
jgi:hypothetical protein